MAEHDDGLPWSTGLFECHNDMGICCITCFCPCVTFGLNAEIINKGSPSCVPSGALWVCLEAFSGLACLFSFYNRMKMREQYTLQGSLAEDCLVHFFCETCALCQEYRELKNQGYDVLLGWQQNLEKQNSDVTMEPVAVEGGMSKEGY